MTPLQAMLENTHSTPRPPAGFDDFWRRTLAELTRVPLDWERIPNAQPPPPALANDWQIDWLRFASWGSMTIYGWLAVPRQTRPEALNRFLWLPGYSFGNPPPARESLYPHTVTFGLNVHGNLPDTPYVHPATQGKEYVTQGIDDPDTYVYRGIVCHCLRALEVLAAQPEVHPSRVMVGGMSQGGGLALLVAALAPAAVALCLADMPWMCDLDRALSLIDRARYARSPGLRIPDSRSLVEDYANARPERHNQILDTFRLFDPLSHAARISCTVQMSAGGRDPACKPATIYAVYNALACDKQMLLLPDVGHEIVPAQHDFHEKRVQQLYLQFSLAREEHTMADQHVGVSSPDAAEITTDGASVTGKHLFADGGDGQEKEATLLSPHAGASSEADPSSGIPSAKTQHGMADVASAQDETPAAGHVIPVRQNPQP